jgi:hypothetical protein
VATPSGDSRLSSVQHGFLAQLRRGWRPLRAFLKFAGRCEVSALHVVEQAPGMPISLAASMGWPWCTRPLTPEYSPSEFSRTMAHFRSSGPQR